MKKFFLTLLSLLLPIISAYSQPNFTAYTAGNPIIPRGPAGSWDAGTVIGASMVFVNDTFYVCYEGVYRDLFYYPNDPMSLGLATSTDGFTFAKSSANPILSGDGSGFDSFSAQAGALYYDNVHWYLYYGGLAAPPTIPTRIISRAIATSPHGPWVRTNDTLLIGGSAGEWDDKCCAALQILPTDSGLVMYYFGSDDWYPNAFTVQHGMATSTDGGATWQKYNDPTTTSPPYAESDPVLKAGPELDIWGAGVIRHDNKWEMFYSGSSANWPPSDTANICYATSADGIHWTKYSGNPIFTYLNDPVSSVGVLEIPTVVFDGSKYFLIYDYGIGQAGIGLATAPRLPGILNVPGQYATIQAAIDAAMEGDTVLVAEGTYYENINFKVKPITVASHFLTNGDTSHISRTIIDGSQPSHPDSGSVVTFSSGEDTTSVLYGFTITGGTGSSLGPVAIGGGGVNCHNSGAKILYNIIENNHVSSGTEVTGGGGIAAGGLINNDSWIIVENNTIRNNSVTNTISNGEAVGGGIGIYCNARVNNNIVEFNKAQSTLGRSWGGGIILGASENRMRYCINNKIWNNKALSPTGTYFDGGIGGGLVIAGSPRAEIRLNDIRYNEVDANISLGIDSWAAGVMLQNQTSETIFAQNYVAFNKSINNCICNGAGIVAWNFDIIGGPQIINNIITNNTGGTHGGGVFTGGFVSNSALLINNTICNNVATNGGAIYVGYNSSNPSHPKIINSILWGNSSSIFVNTGSSATVYYSDVQGGFTGYANIDSDPFLYDSVLVSGDTMFCCLAAHSPCIDAGNPDSSSNDIADPLRPGYALRPAMGTIRNDMGAYGGHGRTEIIVGINRRNDVAQISQTYQLYQNHPNPFNPVTTIEFSLPQAGFVTLKIYNLLGEEVATLFSASLLSGFHSVEFDASDFASGIYYYRLQASSYTAVKKMLLLK